MRVDIHLFGFPRLAIGGRPVEIGLRKGLALLAFVAEAQGSVARDTLAGLLWPEIDQEAARAGLRRTLHRLSIDAGTGLLSADRVAVALNPDVDFVLDTAEFDLACDAKRFDLAATHYTGDFLAGLSLLGCESFEEWTFFRREALRGRLVQALERMVEKSLSAGDGHAALQAALRLLGLDPLSEAAHRQAIVAYLLIGDRHGAERQFEACRKLMAQELGVAPEPETAALLNASGSQAPAATRYADSGGIHLAWQSVGAGTVDVVFVPGFVSHVERAWEEPRVKRFLTALSRLGRLIFFDRRGIGLSDRVGAAPTVEATAEDIATVLDAAGSRRALLIGASEGGPGCIRFAVEHPSRLAGLVLYGSLARGSWSADYPHVLNPAQYEAWLQRLVAQWGGPSEIATFAPTLADDRQARSWWAGLLRAASSPGAIRGVLTALRDTDVTELLPRIEVPTLVLHRTGDRAVRVEAGRQVAAAIPGAQFVEFVGEDHWPWAGDQDALIEKVAGFAAKLGR